MTGLLTELHQVVGPAGLVTDPDLMGGHLTDWRNAYRGTAIAVVRPGGMGRGGNAQAVAQYPIKYTDLCPARSLPRGCQS